MRWAARHACLAPMCSKRMNIGAHTCTELSNKMIMMEIMVAARCKNSIKRSASSVVRVDGDVEGSKSAPNANVLCAF